jgi:transposase
MTAPFSDDLRKRLIDAVESGSSSRSVAERFAVSPSAVIKLVQRFRATGSVAPGKIGGYRKPVLADHEAFLRDLTSSRKGITLAEIREALIDRGIAPCSLKTIWSTLRRFGLRYKKEFESS